MLLPNVLDIIVSQEFVAWVSVPWFELLHWTCRQHV